MATMKVLTVVLGFSVVMLDTTIVNVALQTGSIVGVAVLGGMVSGGEGTAFLDGFHLTVTLAAVVFHVAAVPVTLRLLHHRHAPYHLVD